MLLTFFPFNSLQEEHLIKHLIDFFNGQVRCKLLFHYSCIQGRETHIARLQTMKRTETAICTNTYLSLQIQSRSPPLGLRSQDHAVHPGSLQASPDSSKPKG